MYKIIFILALAIVPRAEAVTYIYEGGSLTHNNGVMSNLSHFNNNALAITSNSGGDVGVKIPNTCGQKLATIVVNVRYLVSAGCAKVGIDNYRHNLLTASPRHCDAGWVERSTIAAVSMSTQNIYGVVRIEGNSVVEIDYMEINVGCIDLPRNWD